MYVQYVPYDIQKYYVYLQYKHTCMHTYKYGYMYIHPSYTPHRKKKKKIGKYHKYFHVISQAFLQHNHENMENEFVFIKFSKVGGKIFFF